MTQITDSVEEIRRRTAAAARRYGRDPATVRLLAVSKQQPAESVQAALAAGQRDFGESYLGEALTKISTVTGPVCWHFIGAVQSNKTRGIAAHFDWVHSVDRLKIARRLSDQRPVDSKPLNVCVEVNVAGEISKSGVAPAELATLANGIANLPQLRLRGLMCLPPPEQGLEQQRRPFAQLRQLFDSLNDHGLGLDTLSMGMSADFEAAIAEGATIIRVGTAVFGPRH